MSLSWAESPRLEDFLDFLFLFLWRFLLFLCFLGEGDGLDAESLLESELDELLEDVDEDLVLAFERWLPASDPASSLDLGLPRRGGERATSLEPPPEAWAR